MELKVKIAGIDLKEDKKLNELEKQVDDKEIVKQDKEVQVVQEDKQNVNTEETIEKKEEVKKSQANNWIKDLNLTDEATKVMLEQVIKRKEKFLTYERKHLITMICMFICVLGYLVYLYSEILKPYSYSLGDVFHAMVSESINGYILIVIFGLYATMQYFYKKREKAEKEFHLLRCEIIDKSKDLWRSDEAWNQRSVVFNLMKENHDINLFHENK